MLSVRDARVEDAAAVAGVHVRSWQAAYRGLLPDAYLDGLRADDRASRYAFGSADPGAPQTFVAEEEAAICGFASIAPSRDRDAGGAGELVAMYVDPPRWGAGVGRLLLAHACDRLRARGCDEAVLWLLAGNERGERFYRAGGWRPDGARRREDLWGTKADVVRYRRVLESRPLTA